MKIELFQNHTFTEYLEINLPERLEIIYSEIEQQKKLTLHQITLVYNGNILPKRGNCSEYQLTNTSTIRLLLPFPITLKSLSPTEGSSFGGTTVFIEGKFPYSSRRYKVVFGTTEVIVNFYTFDKLKVITPAHSPGVVNVTVCYEGGEHSNPLLFTFFNINGFKRQGTRCGNIPTTSLEDSIHNPLV